MLTARVDTRTGSARRSSPGRVLVASSPAVPQVRHQPRQSGYVMRPTLAAHRWQTQVFADFERLPASPPQHPTPSAELNIPNVARGDAGLA